MSPQGAFILAVDVGTSSVKAMTVDVAGQVIERQAAPYRTRYPAPGLLEQNPQDWWQATCRAVRMLSARDQIVGIGLTGHMSALVLLDDRGRPVRPAILLADPRTALGGRELQALEDLSQRSTLLPGPAFTVAKLLWVRQHEPDLYARAAHLCFPKDYVRLRLTGQMATEPTDAHNALLYDAAQDDWSWTVIDALALEKSLFPAIGAPAAWAGRLTAAAARGLGLAAGLPVTHGAADMAATALGMSAYRRDVLSLTLGTAIQVIAHAEHLPTSARGRMTRHPQADLQTHFVMGSVLSGGGVLPWAARLLGLGSGPRALRQMAAMASEGAPGARGVVFMPFAFGRGTPRFDPTAAAGWLQLRAGTQRQDMATAVFEGLAYSVKEAIDAVEGAVGPRQRLFLGGGGAQAPVWPPLLANVLQRTIHRVRVADASTYGAAMLAAVAMGLVRDLDAAVEAWVRTTDAVEPDVRVRQTYERGYALYREHLARHGLLPEPSSEGGA